MARKPKTSRPSFFKVLIKDYASKLRLPHAFVEKYGEFLPQNAKLRPNSGETWDVKLEETDDDDDEDEKYYCFMEGWNEFVKDLVLKLGEFLVFWFNIGKSTFDVSVYGVDACEREISTKSLLVVKSDDADKNFEFKTDLDHNFPGRYKKRLRSYTPKSEARGTDSEAESGKLVKEAHPRFEIVLTESRKLRTRLYKEFAEAAVLIGKRAVVLEYPPKQRYWPVILNEKPGTPLYPEFSCGLE